MRGLDSPSHQREALLVGRSGGMKWGTKSTRPPPGLRLAGVLRREFRRRPTLPDGLPSSTIGAEELNFRVRNEIGWDLLAMVTGNCESVLP